MSGNHQDYGDGPPRRPHRPLLPPDRAAQPPVLSAFAEQVEMEATPSALSDPAVEAGMADTVLAGAGAQAAGEGRSPDRQAAGILPPALSIVSTPDQLSPAREITATTPAAKILFTRDDFDTTYISGRKGMMVLSLVEDGTSYRVGRYDEASGEWRILSKGWPRFGNALAFACTIVS